MHYYKILKHNAGFDEGTNYWEKLLERYLAATGGGKIHTTLPITFTSTSWKLASWTIYGNNTPHNYSTSGTLPRTFTTHMAGNAVDWTIEGNNNVGKNKFETPNISETWYTVNWSVENGVLKGVGTYGDSAAHTRPRLQGQLPAGSYILSGSPDYTTTGIRLQIGTCTDSQGTNFAALGYDEGSGFSFTLQADSWLSVRVWTNSALYQRVIDVLIPIMIRTADTSAVFEPFQVGVGQRTKNLFELKRVSDYNGVTAQSIIAYGVTFTVSGDKVALSNQSTNIYPQIFLNSISGQDCPKLESGKTYSAKVFVENKPANSTIYIHVKVKNRNDTNWQSGYVAKIKTSGTTFTVSQDWDIWGYLLIAQGNNVTYQDTNVRFCLTEGSTAPQTYIPYGYEIPITVNSTTQDIYIGDSPLTEGETVSKTSTGVDIAAIAGTNTITTELYNKPSMSIEGVDYVGVGERTGNLINPDETTQGDGYVANSILTSAEPISSTLAYITEYIPVEASMSYCIFRDLFRASTTATNKRSIVVFYDTNKNGIGYVEIRWHFTQINYDVSNCDIFSTPENCKYVRLTIDRNSTLNMLVKGSVPPSEYIPYGYQVPLTVTHYTDNIFDKDAKNANKGYEDSTCIMWAGSIPYPYMTGNIPEDNNCFVSEKIPASPNTTYYLTDGIFKNTDNGIYSVFLWNRFRMSDYQAFPTEKTFTTGDDTKFIQLCVLKSYADTVMITTKPTETYIPHVEVNNVNVPIDAPLTEGQTVSDTTEIEVFEGENTIDTTLYNKPVMEIEYE